MSNKNISIKKVSTSINNSYFLGRKFRHNSTSGAEMILAGFSRYIYICFEKSADYAILNL